MKKAFLVAVLAGGGASALACSSAAPEDELATDQAGLTALPITKNARVLGIRTWKDESKSGRPGALLSAVTQDGRTLRVDMAVSEEGVRVAAGGGSITFTKHGVQLTNMSREDATLFAAFVDGATVATGHGTAPLAPRSYGMESTDDPPGAPYTDPQVYVGDGYNPALSAADDRYESASDTNPSGSNPSGSGTSPGNIWDKCKSTDVSLGGALSVRVSLECIFEILKALNPCHPTPCAANRICLPMSALVPLCAPAP